MKISGDKRFRSTTDEWINHKEKIEEAESIFYDDTWQNIIESADETHASVFNTDYIKATSIDYEVHITEIKYDLDEEDDDLDLPKELTLWVESDRDKEDYDDDFEFDDIVRYAIEDEVGWPVKNFRYKILSSR